MFGSSKLCFYHSNIINILHMDDTNHHFWSVTPPSTDSSFVSSICKWTWLEWSRQFQSKQTILTRSLKITGALAILKQQLETLHWRFRSQLQEVRTQTSNSLISNSQFKKLLAVLFLHHHWSLTLNQLLNSMITQDFNLIFRN